VWTVDKILKSEIPLQRHFAVHVLIINTKSSKSRRLVYETEGEKGKKKNKGNVNSMEMQPRVLERQCCEDDLAENQVREPA
jgi:hypothetical protein